MHGAERTLKCFCHSGDCARAVTIGPDYASAPVPVCFACAPDCRNPALNGVQYLAIY